MDETLSIITALASLSQSISNMNTRATSASRTPTDSISFLNPYYSFRPFDLFSRSGSDVDTDACAPVYELCDSQVKTLPSFIISVCICVNKLKWNAATPHGILSVTTGGNTNHEIITKYRSILSANIANAFFARTNDQSIHNSKAFYAILSKYITETTMKTAKIFTLFTVVASLQLSILSFNQITSLPLLT